MEKLKKRNETNKSGKQRGKRTKHLFATRKHDKNNKKNGKIVKRIKGK